MSFTLEKICVLIEADIPDHLKQVEIKGISAIEDAAADDICFLSNPKYGKFLATTKARAVIVSKETTVPDNIIGLAVDDPYYAFVKLLHLFNPRTSSDIASGIDPGAFIHPEAIVGNGVSVGSFAVISAGASIGDGTVVGPNTVILAGSSVGKDCILYPNVTIMDGCEIRDRVILHSGAVIGSDGFGFAPFEGSLHKIPQIGTVLIEDDVEIGACTCIDRAVFGATVIEKGVKLDNLIQVGHNVRIGSHTVSASQVGISGSTSIGSGVKLGGQAGLSGHLTIGDGASVGAQAGVTKDVPAGEVVSGYPAKNHMKAMRLEAALRHLPDLMKKVKDQGKRIQELERLAKERR